MEIPIIYKILPERVVYVERQLPGPGKKNVSAGSKVEPFDILAKAKVRGGVEKVDVCKQLGIDPANLPEFIFVQEGDSVERGQILAEKKSFFNLRSDSVKAPFSSTIESIDWETGSVCLALPKRIAKLGAGVGGEIVDIADDKAFLIKTQAATVKGVYGWGQSCAGTLRIAAQRGESLHANCILPSDEEKILIGGSYLEAEAIKKAEIVGVRGIVVGSVDYPDLDFIKKSEISIMLTEGFGRAEMPEKLFNYLEKSNKIYTLLMPERGNLLVARNPENISYSAVPDKYFRKLEKGDTVEIFSRSLFGRVGKVVDIDFEFATIETQGEQVEVSLRNLGILV